MEELIIKHETGLGPVARDALKIRDVVFIEEQGIRPAREHDHLDDQRLHYVGYMGDQAVTTARVEVEGTSWHIERVATLKEMRGQGLARHLLICIMQDAQKLDVNRVYLAAQVRAQRFYEELGFKAVGEHFLDAGLEHIEMEKSV
ncbi:GNAT family N-acetyltransferase [Pediococcus pentosaceus]|uniref:GNAT family N-acetyltransferase n=1 Tax=Pediococcus pentosaceus TaxID=1255 RepID=UPI00398228CA